MRRWRGSAADFHARTVDEGAGPELWVFDIERPALVLGSSQSIDTIDRDAVSAGGIELVRRRSGGGAVLLDPGEVVWFDVIVPAPLLAQAGLGTDVAAAMRWVGGLLSVALGGLGVIAAVHQGPMVTTPWSPVICFDGLGPGELVRGDAKLVGISARRTRDHTRFQCAMPLTWRVDRLIGLLTPPRPAATALRPVARAPVAVGAALPAATAAALAATLVAPHP